MPTLLFVSATASLNGGGEISQFELAIAAKQRGYRVHAIVPARGELYKQFRANGIDCLIISYMWWNQPPTPDAANYNIAAIGSIVKYAQQIKADCIITNSLNIPWGAVAAASCNIPHVWVSREWAEYQFSYLADRYDFFAAFSNVILANSQTNANYIKEKTGLKNIPHVYPYINVNRYKLGPAKNATRIVNVGSIQPRKNQLDLVEAVGKLYKKTGIAHELHLIGPQWDEKYLEKIKHTAELYGIDKQLNIHGFRTNPYELVGPDDIFVVTSAYETFGRITVESMKLGLITVAADIPVTREVLGQGGGVLYKAGSSSDLSKKLSGVFKKLDTAQKDAAEAKKRALQNFSSRQCQDPFFEAIESILGKDNPQRVFRHLANDLVASAISTKNHEQAILKQQEVIQLQEQMHQQVINSKTWRIARRIRKTLKG